MRLNQPKPAALRLAHVLVGLLGGRGVLGEASFNDALSQLQRLRPVSKPVQAAYASAQQAMGHLNQSPALLHEEALAYLVQNHPKTSLAQQIIAAVRAFLYRAGLRMNLTENDLHALAVSAVRSAARGRLRAGTMTPGARGQNSQDVEAQRQYDAVVARYTLPDGTKAPGWMKAPNGQPTKLNKRQWVQVRTENFKRWFGDWEAVAIKAHLEAPPIATVTMGVIQAGPHEKASDAAKRWLRQNPQQVTRAGFGTVIFDEKSIETTLGHGFSGPKLNALTAVADVIRQGVMLDSSQDWEGKPLWNTVLAAPILLDGKSYTLFVRLRKDIANKAAHHRFYVHEAVLEEVIQGAKASPFKTGPIPQSGGKVSGGTGFYVSLARTALNVDSDTVSQVVDANGEPLVVYHGTDQDFGEFSFKWFGRTDAGARGKGFYFTKNADYASRIAESVSQSGWGEPNVMPVYLRAKNPYEWNNEPNNLGMTVEGFSSWLKENGYDAVHHAPTDEWVVFTPTQIKSALGNTGAFSPDNADIRFAYSLGQTEPNLTAEEVLQRIEAGGEVTADEFALLQAYLSGASRALAATGVDAPSFKEWFGASKIKNKAGQPVKMYHGTASDFTVFDAQKAGGSTKHPTAALGFFFTNNRAHAAEKYGDRVMEVYLSLERPYLMTDADLRRIDTLEEALAFRKRLEQQGYDGIVMPAETKTRYVVAFRPDQIKRTTNETYTRGEKDMRFALANPRPLTPEQQAAMDKIGRRDPQGWGQRFAGLRERIGLKLRQAIADHHAALLDLDRQAYGNEVVENQTAAASWVKARLSRSVDGPMHLLLHETGLRLDADGALDVLPNVKGLQKVLEPNSLHSNWWT